MDPAHWRPCDVAALRIASAWVCFARDASGPGAAGDPAWAAALMMRGQRIIEHAVVYGAAAAGYIPGLLGLRIGPLLCEAVGRRARSWDVLLVDATGRDHPRRAGLALHLGAVLEQPTVGVTNRALVADGAWPEDTTGAAAPLLLDGETVGFWLRSRADRGARRLANRPQHRPHRRHGVHGPNADPFSAAAGTPNRATSPGGHLIRSSGMTSTAGHVVR
jgi:deoxyribonuclease V